MNSGRTFYEKGNTMFTEETKDECCEEDCDCEELVLDIIKETTTDGCDGCKGCDVKYTIYDTEDDGYID